ncbi:hypothetical protein QTP86_026523 [Hemibagrus guttatus]|nr:hypothetical protein QTP86_026523 [Hemibagrus guttatus]
MLVFCLYYSGLLSSDYVEIHYEEGKPITAKGGEHCYYHGQVRGNEASRVALSTCDGLHGMFDDGVYAYFIEPLKHSIDGAARPHKLHRAPSFLSSQHLKDADEEDQLDDMAWLRRRKKRAMPRNVFEEMKYIELMIVSDHNMFKRHKTKQQTRNFAKSVVNLVDSVFIEQLNTRVVLVAMEIWTDKDHMPISVLPLDMLRDFSKYRQQHIRQHADAVHLFSQEYKELQRRVKREVSKAKQKAYEELYTRLDTREGEKDLYRLARQRDRDGKDMQQVRVIKDRDGRVLTSEESVQRRWKEYFEELMNEENEREKRVEGVNSVEQKVDKIRKDEVRKALKRMKSGKAVGPDDIPVEVWKCLGEAAVEFLANLFNRVLESERMPEEWRRSVLVPIFKNKGDVQSCSNYRGIKLMSHTMKVWERVVEARLRKVVEICEQQYGFMPRKSTTDAIFALRILMEKYRDGQKELHCVFVDLEKAYDRVPREELWYCMRKSGVAEKYVRVVQDMYERSRTVVRCAVGQTEEFNVEVGLHQGSALSPFLFAMVMDQLSEEVRQESPWTMMFADDIVICSESREQVEENLERWRFALERRGMKVSRSKTEYMCVNEREGSGTVRLQGEEVKKVQEFKYLGSTVQSNGECGKEVKKRVQAGWNGWRKVSGVLCDQKISARIKGKVYRTVVRPAMLYGLETVSLRKRQESELEVAELKMLSNVTFHYRQSSAAFFGGMCSLSRGVGVNEYGSAWTLAVSLSQSLAQNLGIQWDPLYNKNKECGCVDSWVGCIMEDTGVQHPRRFSKCSISDYKEFLLKGGGSCLFNRPNKLFESTECGNGYVELGEECDCGVRADCYKECCKKCSLSNGAHCSDGPCCNSTCLFYPRGFSCRYAVNDCDISETCSGDSGQCPPNLHKQDGSLCHLDQGRCYSGECKTRESQCKYVWGPKSGGSEKFCYEKLNTEGSEKGNCGEDGGRWIQCGKHDVFCGYLLCTNVGPVPRIGRIRGEITPTSFNHQGRLIECSGGHVFLDDETDLGYVEDGMPCGPSMMCLDRKCLPIQYFNMSACPTGPNGRICSNHGVCNNEATCTCDVTWAGTDCSIPDPPKEPASSEDDEPRETSKSEGTIQMLQPSSGENGRPHIS